MPAMHPQVAKQALEKFGFGGHIRPEKKYADMTPEERVRAREGAEARLSMMANLMGPAGSVEAVDARFDHWGIW